MQYIKVKFPASKVPDNEELIADDAAASEFQVLQSSHMEDLMDLFHLQFVMELLKAETAY